MNTPLLNVKDLHVFFKTQKKKLHAVRGAHFQLFEGETLGIVGESGSGKSAMAKAIVKLVAPHSTLLSGEVWYEGQNLLSLTEKEMQKIRGKEIGMIFQDPMTSLNPTMKVGKQIIEGYLRHNPHLSMKEAESYAIEMLEMVGIPEPDHRINEYPHTLSGGMRQRVMIALALATKPRILLADEPTTALDVTIQAQILDQLKRIKQKMGTSIILITHDLSVVAGFCDRVLVMYGGEIIENAPVDSLFSHPQHPYTQRLLQSIPRLDLSRDHPLLPIEGTPPDLTQTLVGCSFFARCPHAMTICREQPPKHFAYSDRHTSSCWLKDPRVKR